MASALTCDQNGPPDITSDSVLHLASLQNRGFTFCLSCFFCRTTLAVVSTAMSFDEVRLMCSLRVALNTDGPPGGWLAAFREDRNQVRLMHLVRRPGHLPLFWERLMLCVLRLC